MAKEKDKYKVDGKKLLQFSEETMDPHLQSTSYDYYLLQKQRNLVKAKVDSLIWDKQKLRAEIIVSEKSSPAYDRTPSDKFVDAIVHDTEEYMTLKKQIIEQEQRLSDLDAIVKAMEMKAKLMQTLSSNSRFNQ